MGGSQSHTITYLDQTKPLLSIKNTYIKDNTNPIMLESFDNEKNINIFFIIFIIIIMNFIIIYKKNDKI
jgi:hypothetical protein